MKDTMRDTARSEQHHVDSRRKKLATYPREINNISAARWKIYSSRNLERGRPERKRRRRFYRSVSCDFALNLCDPRDVTTETRTRIAEDFRSVFSLNRTSRREKRSSIDRIFPEAATTLARARAPRLISSIPVDSRWPGKDDTQLSTMKNRRRINCDK